MKKQIVLIMTTVLLFSFGAPLITSAQLADTSWPIFRHDLNHTGLSPYIGSPVGVERWDFSTGADVYSSPAIGADGTIYVGSFDNKLYAIYPNGTKRWHFSTGDNVDSSPAIGTDGTIYVGSGNKLYAIYPNGTERWNFSIFDAGVDSSPAIGTDGTIYVGYNDNKLHAIYPNDTERWNFTTGGSVCSSPAIGMDGTIYVGSYDNKLHAIGPEPALAVNKTVWNGTAWVKALDAKINDTVQFNCTITNTGNVNLSEILFWDILDCSLEYVAGSGWVTTNVWQTFLEYSGIPAPLFKHDVLHPSEAWNLSDPFGSNFYALCSDAYYGYIDYWVDHNLDGNVSAGDQIAIAGCPHHYYRVERVPHTLSLFNATYGTTYFDSVLNWTEVDLSDPNETKWFEVCSCKDWYNLTAWYDTNVTGDLNVNDTLVLQNTRTGEVAQYTVEEVAIDLAVSQEYAIDEILYGEDKDFILEPGQTITIEYNATVVKCGVDNNTFRAKGDSNCSAEGEDWTYSNEDKVTITVPCVAPSGNATDPTGFSKEVYATDEDVYAVGTGFAPNKKVSIYIIPYMTLVGGEDLNALKIAGPVNVTTDDKGDIGFVDPVLIWPNPVPGHYLMVFDDPNGEYNPDTDPFDDFSVIGAAVPVVTPFGLVALIGLLSIVAINTLVRKRRN
jgi:uncharacterized repeat protein (TIGR01451 family)